MGIFDCDPSASAGNDISVCRLTLQTSWTGNVNTVNMAPLEDLLEYYKCNNK
jgi:hypothetical protein